MPNIITITQLETVINRVREAAPPLNYILSPDLRALAEVYGRMIGEHAKSIDLEQEPDALRKVLPEMDAADRRHDDCLRLPDWRIRA